MCINYHICTVSKYFVTIFLFLFYFIIFVFFFVYVYYHCKLVIKNLLIKKKNLDGHDKLQLVAELDIKIRF